MQVLNWVDGRYEVGQSIYLYLSPCTNVTYACETSIACLLVSRLKLFPLFYYSQLKFSFHSTFVIYFLRSITMLSFKYYFWCEHIACMWILMWWHVTSSNQKVYVSDLNNMQCKQTIILIVYRSLTLYFDI